MLIIEHWVLAENCYKSRSSQTDPVGWLESREQDPMAKQGDIVGRISSTEDLDSLWALATSYFSAIAFGGIAYMLLQRGQPEQPLAIFTHGATEDIDNAYKNMGYAQHDPAARYALTTGKPFNVDHLPGLTEFSRQETRTYQALQDIGATNVLILPVFGPGTAHGLFALAYPAAPDLPSRLNWDELQAVAQLFHLQTIRLQPDRVRALANPLSERELEILRWVAQGKSNSVIADILEIAGGTVDTYLRRIFEKLDVTDRTAAAVRGVSYGFIRG